MFDRYISIIDRKMSNTNEYFINRFTSIVWKNSIVNFYYKNCNGCSTKGLPAIEGTTWSNKKEIPVFQICIFRLEINIKCSKTHCH